MTAPRRFPYARQAPGPGPAGFAPFVPIELVYQGSTVTVSGLIDSGATLNVLPHSVGLQLGAVWARQTVSVPLGGVLSGTTARAIELVGTVDPFPPVRLVFAWADSDAMPVLLGRMNFFLAFDICFSGAKSEFTIAPATP